MVKLINLNTSTEAGLNDSEKLLLLKGDLIMKFLKGSVPFLLLLSMQSFETRAEMPDTPFRGQFTASGISEDGIPSEAELDMFHRARHKCNVIGGPTKISRTVFRESNDFLYASARFDCVESPLDRRGCWYPDDSNPYCFPPK